MKQDEARHKTGQHPDKKLSSGFEIKVLYRVAVPVITTLIP